MSYKTNTETAQNYLLKIVLFLVAGIGLVVPLGSATRNIDVQGLLLLLCGFYAAVSLAWQPNYKLYKIDIALFVGLIIAALISVSIAKNIPAALFGGLHYRVGTLSLIGSIAIGLALSSRSKLQNIQLLYITTGILGIAAIPYSVYFSGDVLRLYGTLYQPDILAAVLGCGFLFGLYLLHREPSKKYVWILQTVLLVDLVMTESRAVLIMVFLFSLIYMFKLSRDWKLIPIFGVLLAAFLVIAPLRITSADYFGKSLTYRSALQAFALHKVIIKPFGYGAGNLYPALDCRVITTPVLARTCQQGLGFDSSHNWFIDRFLEYGWLGGLCFMLLTIRALFVRKILNQEVFILELAFLLLALYSITNVSSIEIEIFFWIILFCLISNSPSDTVNIGQTAHTLKYSYGRKKRTASITKAG